jgi:membrane-associated phospholipid phosphatase
MQRTAIFHLLLGVAFWGILTVIGYLLFVLTGWGQNFDCIAYLGHHDVARGIVYWSYQLLQFVNLRTLLAASAVLITISLIRRRFALGLMAIIGITCALSGAEFFKDHLPRPELGDPSNRAPKFLSGESYPSGHTTFATSIVFAFLLVSSPRWRPWMASVAGLVSALFAISVVIVGGHRPADPVGAIFWSTFCMGLAAAIAFSFSGLRPIGWPHPLALALSTFLCLTTIVVAWLSMCWRIPSVSQVNLPLLIMLAIIVFAAFMVTAWFGWVLSWENDKPKLIGGSGDDLP